ncbi:MAG: FtsW/RodA/SpoVE family cell cycle protein [Paraprevotella sp.]|nr:FtsW/RodA/SpoVE family cell cycle protein [Paraprevotella sp.]
MIAPAKVFKKWSLFEGDKVIWMILFFLGIISIIEVYSASSYMSYKSGDYWRPILQHASYFVVGVIATILIHKIPCRYFKLIPVFGIPLSVVLLIIAMFTAKVNNASRWLEVGGIGFQPSEIAKGVLVATTAMILSSMRDEAGAQRRAFKWIMGMVVLICGLIVPENFSTAAMTFLVVMVMMFIGGIPWKQLGTLTGIIVIVGASLFAFLRLAPDSTLDSLSEMPGLHRLPTWASRVKERGDLPVNAADYDITKNPQVTHAKIAIATCNVIGRGPGNSVERDFLPQSFSDFIYAIVIEELGLAGGIFVMFLYIVLLFRSARIAGRCERNFPAFLVMGLSLMLVMQALINMAVAVGIFPVTGQPLPLISKGGTSTMINCAYLGIILSVSRSAKKKPQPDSE